MSIKHNNEDWVNKICTSLKEGEEMPSIGGWARLERDLISKQTPRNTLLPIWARRAMAVAAVVICLVTGGLLSLNEDVIPTMVDEGLQLANIDIIGVDVSEERIERVVEMIIAEKIEGEYKEHSLRKSNIAENSQVIKNSGVEEANPTTILPTPSANINIAKESKTEDNNRESVALMEESKNVETKTSIETKQRTYTPLPSLSQSGLLAMNEDYAPKKAKKFGVSAYFGGGFSQPNNSAVNTPISNASSLGASDGMISLARLYANYSYNHKQPLSFGITARKEFSSGLSLETGVVYSLLRSDVTILDSTDPLKQSLHYLGIPLRLNWSFVNTSHFSVYLGIGGMGEKLLSAEFDSNSISEKELQWSVSGAIGIQYDITKYAGIYFEPKVSHYFTDTTLRTVRTDSDAILTLQFGLRFTY